MFYAKQNGIQTQGDFSRTSSTKLYGVETSSINIRQVTNRQAMTNKDLIGASSMMFVKGHNQKLYSLFNSKL